MADPQGSSPLDPPPALTKRMAAVVQKSAFAQIKGAIEQRAWGALFSLVLGLFASALPALAVGTVAGTIAGHYAGRSAANTAVAAKTPVTDAKGPVDFGAAGTAQGTIAVDSDPPAARVTVDGVLVGQTPITRLLADPGQRAIVVTLDGYTPFVGSIVVKAGAPATVHATLTKEKEAPPKKVAAAPVYVAPQRTYRSCDSERSDCDNRCGSVEFNCRNRCHCQDKPPDVCQEEMNGCYSQCTEIKVSCESSCDAAKESCEASNQ
jgi:hypothetical protein